MYRLQFSPSGDAPLCCNGARRRRTITELVCEKRTLARERERLLGDDAATGVYGIYCRAAGVRGSRVQGAVNLRVDLFSYTETGVSGRL